MNQSDPDDRGVGETRASAPVRVLRFDRNVRLVHWCNAALFATVMLTGAVLYIGSLSSIVGHRATVRSIHTYVGIAIPAPLIVGLLGARGSELRRDLGRLNRWSPDDFRWLRRRHRVRGVRLGKFNPGQKLNAAFIGGAIVVMLATGYVMRWYEPFSDSWRTGAEFAHDLLAFGIWAAVIGHIVLALADREALRAMTFGWVSVAWARRRRPAWLDEMVAEGHGLELETETASEALEDAR